MFVSTPVKQEIPLSLKFNIGMPERDKSRAWLLTTNEYVFFPILTNVDRLEMLVLP